MRSLLALVLGFLRDAHAKSLAETVPMVPNDPFPLRAASVRQTSSRRISCWW